MSDQILLHQLLAARDQLNLAIATLQGKPFSSGDRPPKPAKPVKLDVDIGNSLIRQTLLCLYSDKLPVGLIEPGKPISVVMPQINQVFKSSWIAQYRLRARSELRALVDYAAGDSHDLTRLSRRKVHLEIAPNREWHITIR